MKWALDSSRPLDAPPHACHFPFHGYHPVERGGAGAIAGCGRQGTGSTAPCPRALWPFAQLARWDRPIGWWLLMWPCWWSAALAVAAPAGTLSWQLPFHLALFMIGAIAMRGAGCTL